MEAHWYTEETHAPYHSAQEMAPERVCAVGHPASFWQQLPHRVPCTPGSTRERLEEGAEGEAIQGLEVLLFLPDRDPTRHEPRAPAQNESLADLVGEAVEAGVRAGKSPRVAAQSWPGRGKSNPDAEWILAEPRALVRNGLDPAQSPSSAPAGLVAPRKPVRMESLGRNTGRVSNPGQGDALLLEGRTTRLPLRMSESSAGQLLLPAARRHFQPSPTDPHFPRMCPNCGSDRDSTVCQGQALATKNKKSRETDYEGKEKRRKKSTETERKCSASNCVCESCLSSRLVLVAPTKM